MKLVDYVYAVLTLVIFAGCTHLGFDISKSQNSISRDSTLSPPTGTYPAEITLETEAAEIRASTNSAVAARQLEAAVAGSGEDTPQFEGTVGADLSPTKKVQADLDEALELCQLSQDNWQEGELENAVEALDRAYALILSADTAESPKLVQQKEDLRFMISKRILEIYASRNIVVNGNHNAIPVVINRHVQKEIDLFTKGRERQSFIQAYRRSGRYRPAIVNALTEAGLPTELSWLPLIESSFKVRALSRSRALGLWQFIPSTGYKFGLTRNKFIDERMDPTKSTAAAIDYLKELHGMFGDWSTVLAGYNCGEMRVLRVIRSQNLNYLDNFWDLYERLPRETARYVPRFLATLHIINNLEQYGMDQIAVDPPLVYETVIVDKQVHLKNVAKSIGVHERVLKELNPELRYKILPGNKYNLKIPSGTGELLLANIDQIPVSHPPRRAYVYHRVRPGETLSVISRKYRTSVGSIMRANNLRRSNYIVAGKLLKIPQRGYISYKSKAPKKTNDGRRVTHIVRKGDSLYIIAKQYGTTTKRIQELNNLSTTNLYKGQVLTIFPGAGQHKSPLVAGLPTYKVRPGDSPFIIAKRHNMPLERFLQLNQLYPGSKIYPGQRLYID
ncbi:MAG: LysM peptidoglycan-binding domain-containing protein [Desulfobacterales bacterium]|jgi:membrane-bound lytic murein transglycosylase D